MAMYSMPMYSAVRVYCGPWSPPPFASMSISRFDPSLSLWPAPNAMPPPIGSQANGQIEGNRVQEAVSEPNPASGFGLH